MKREGCHSGWEDWDLMGCEGFWVSGGGGELKEKWEGGGEERPKGRGGIVGFLKERWGEAEESSRLSSSTSVFEAEEESFFCCLHGCTRPAG